MHTLHAWKLSATSYLMLIGRGVFGPWASSLMWTFSDIWMNQIRKLIKFAHRNLYLRLLNLMASLLVPLECSGKLKQTHSNTVGFSQFRVHHRQRVVVDKSVNQLTVFPFPFSKIRGKISITSQDYEDLGVHMPLNYCMKFTIEIC